MNVLEAILKIVFSGGCLLVIYGVVMAVALLGRPRGWVCHLRGLTLIGLFVMAATGVCSVVFSGLNPELPSAIFTALTGSLLYLYGRQLRINAERIRTLRGRAALNEVNP